MLGEICAEFWSHRILHLPTSSLEISPWASEVPQPVKVLAKPEDLSLIPITCPQKEGTDSCKLSYDFCIFTEVYGHLHKYAERERERRTETEREF